MPIFTKEDSKLYFIHIPRTAGRFVGSIFLANNYGAKYHTSNPNFYIAGIEPMHLHYPLYNRYLKVDEIEHFTIIRNPVDKIWSALNLIYKIHNPENFIENLENKKWFQDFIEYQRSHGSYFNNWFMPQQNFVSYKTKVYRYEDGIDNLVSWININFNTKLEYKNSYSDGYIMPEEIGIKKEPVTNKIRNNIIDYYIDDCKKFDY